MTERMGISLHVAGVRRGGRWVLKDISLQLRGAQRWALLGGNGAGKTQLLKLIAGDVWPTPTGRERRIYRIGRRQIELADAKPRIGYVGAERQDKYARYGWDLPVCDLVATGLHGSALLLEPVTAAQSRRVREVLAACGLTARAAAHFLSLSYGQKRLAMLARALAPEPDWLLLDEMYNGLDVHYRRRLDDILEERRRRGQSWIAAAHRAIDVPRGTTRVLELDGGRVRRVGRMAAGIWGAAAADDAQCTSRGAVRVSRPPVAPRRRGAMLLRIVRADLYVGYRRVLAGVDWEMRKGEHWAVLGDNGAGKSSFLKLLYGDLSPAHGGRLERRGFPAGTPIEAWKRHVGYVSPELQADYAVDVSLLDLVASGRHASIGLCEAATAQDRSTATRWLRFFGLSTAARRRPRELSYGQLRRALIARALAGSARMLLLDEPLTGLDPRQRAATKRLLARLMRRGVAMIIAVHHLEDLPRGMTHVLHLHKRQATVHDSNWLQWAGRSGAVRPRRAPCR